ncbi:endonuclease [Paraferrimonas haliotis]|nr:endonuclease [Paraferrimonas haliotis]
MNKTFSALTSAATLLLVTVSSAARADLVITEYVEGGGQNKAVEVSNLGTDAVNLDSSKYVLTLYSNGKTEPGNSATLTGSLAAGKSVVFHNGDAEDEFKVGTASTVTYFSGDDAIVLSKDGTPIDRFGKVGERPDKAWLDPNNPNFSTVNKTLRRKASVTTGDANISAAFPGADNQWLVFDQDTSDGLGCPGEGACTKEPGSLIISEYVVGSSYNKAVELSNVGGSALDLDAAAYKLVLFTNGKTTPEQTETLSGTLNAGESIVFYNNQASDDFKAVGSASQLTTFNGNDALVLYKDDVVIDRLGKLGEDPGTAWTDPNNADFTTKGKTLRRQNAVRVGETDATAEFPGANNTWIVFDKDTADGLGCSGESACSSTGGDTGSTGGTPVVPNPNQGPCNNCENLTAVADPASFDINVYYSAVDSGSFDNPEAMKDAISAVIAKGHHKLSYKQVWSAITYADEDPSNPNNVIELYTGASTSKYSNGGNPTDWNREHTWAKSHGFPRESMNGYTDAHHLRPANVKVNGIRSNYDFDECSDTGTEVQGAPGNYLDASKRCFEPRDEVKGDIARMIMYMDTRYQGNDQNMPDLVAVDRITTKDEVSANQPYIGKLCTLYKWHQQDPVDATDQRRNDAVYKYQGNRNPYIDHPEWVQQVYGAQCGDAPTPQLDVNFVVNAPEKVVEGDTLTIDASATVAVDGSDITFNWEQVAGPDVTFSADKPVLEVTAPEVAQDSQLQFKLTVTDGTLTASKLVNVTLENVPFSLDVSFDGITKLIEGDSTTITASIAQAPEDLTYLWKQVSGNPADYDSNGLVLNVTAPEVALNQSLVFELTISDGSEQVVKQVNLEVTNVNAKESGWTQPDGAGSFGLGLLLLLPLALNRRR